MVGDGSAERLEPAAAVFHRVTAGVDLPEVPVVLEDGAVLLTGGVDRAATPTPPPGAQDSYAPASTAAVLLNLASGDVRPVGPMGEARLLHEAMRLPNGRVLIAGGAHEVHFSDIIASAELFDPADETFSSTGDMAVGRVWFTLTPLPGGDVLVVGSNSQPGDHAAERYVV